MCSPPSIGSRPRATLLGIAHEAYGHDAPVAVAVAVLASHVLALGSLDEPSRGHKSAPPLLATQAAGLVSLGRVDPMQPHALAGNLDGIAVDHPGRALEIGGQGRRRGQDQNEDACEEGTHAAGWHRLVESTTTAADNGRGKCGE